jgi:hypothetical protein
MIDFDAAMNPAGAPKPESDSIDFEAAMIPKKPGRPPKKLPAPTAAPSNGPSNTYIGVSA